MRPKLTVKLWKKYEAKSLRNICVEILSLKWDCENPKVFTKSSVRFVWHRVLWLWRWCTYSQLTSKSCCSSFHIISQNLWAFFKLFASDFMGRLLDCIYIHEYTTLEYARARIHKTKELLQHQRTLNQWKILQNLNLFRTSSSQFLTIECANDIIVTFVEDSLPTVPNENFICRLGRVKVSLQ